MNAAARLVHQNVLTRHLVLTQLLTKQQILVLVLAVAVVVSAISTIYTTHVSRMLYAEHERNAVETTRLQIEHSQLLLELSSTNMPARIEQKAKQQGMVIPDNSSFVIVKE